MRVVEEYFDDILLFNGSHISTFMPMYLQLGVRGVHGKVPRIGIHTIQNSWLFYPNLGPLYCLGDSNANFGCQIY